jgi:hypothetical protein
MLFPRRDSHVSNGHRPRVQPYTIPGNLMRKPLSGAAVYSGSGIGSGGCNDAQGGPTDFGGAAENQITGECPAWRQ